MKKVLLTMMLSLCAAPLFATPLTFGPGVVDGSTTVFSAPLGGLGLLNLATITIVDSDSTTGGSPGVFSGFDLDFIFIDIDGDYSTSGIGDRVFGSVFDFTAGTTRTPDLGYTPTALHSGPTFGALSSNSIDFATATLSTRDGVYGSPLAVDTSSGWLTLGDGGSLIISFIPAFAITANSRLFVGEVGNELGEALGATVTARSDVPVPEPASLSLFGLGTTWFAWRRRRAAKTN